MSDRSDQPGKLVFENPNAQVGNSTLLFAAGIGLILFAIAGFIIALGTKQGQLSLHLMTTMPMIAALGMLARAFSMRNLPRRIVVDPGGIEVTTTQWTSHYPWFEIGTATTENILNSHKSCLRITDTTGKTIIRIDESFPDYVRLVKLIESFVDSKPDDTSFRILSRKAKQRGFLCFAFGCLLCFAVAFIALEAHEKQRVNELLPVKGVHGDGEIVRRFIAPNGVTRRIEFRIAGSKVKNVEVEPIFWDQLENAKNVPVIYVPDDPDINRLEFGEVNDDDFLKSPRGGYLLSGLGGLLALLVLGLSPLFWWGYDLAFDEKQRTWKLKRYGRVVWASKKDSERTVA